MRTVNSQIIILLRLSIPIIIGNFAYALLSVSDTVMAGMAGKSDLGGVSIGGAFFIPALVFIQGMISALHPIIGRHRGANEYQKIPYAHFTSFIACLFFAIIIMGLLALINYKFLVIDSDDRMQEVAKGYILTVIFTIPVMACFSTLRAYCEAMGDTKVTLYFGLLALVYNIPLNYIFIFGKLGAPALGGIGCGVATLISMCISTLCLIGYILWNHKLKTYALISNKEKLKYKDLFSFIKLGVPLGLSSSVECSCFTLIALLLAPLGAVIVAAHSIALSIATFIYTIPLSIGIAISIMVGYAIGEKNIENLKLNIKAAYRIAFMSATLALLIIGIGNKHLIAIYTNDEEVIAIGAILLTVAFFNQIFENLQTIQAFILRGFKDTKSILYITIITFYCIALPVGYLLCYEYIKSPFNGPLGFWIGLLLGLSSASLLYRIRVLKHYRALKKQQKLGS